MMMMMMTKTRQGVTRDLIRGPTGLLVLVSPTGPRRAQRIHRGEASGEPFEADIRLYLL